MVFRKKEIRIKDRSFVDNFMDEFDLLIQQGNLGFYTSCEVTHVIVFDKKNRQAYNYYTVLYLKKGS